MPISFTNMSPEERERVKKKLEEERKAALINRIAAEGEKFAMPVRLEIASRALSGLLASSDVSLRDFEAYARCAIHHADALIAAHLATKPIVP